MIFIFDNGLDYDDNDTLFVDAGDTPREAAAAFMRVAYPESALLGQAERVEWFNGGSAPTLESWAWRVALNAEDDTDALYQLDVGLLRRAVEYLDAELLVEGHGDGCRPGFEIMRSVLDHREKGSAP